MRNKTKQKRKQNKTQERILLSVLSKRLINGFTLNAESFTLNNSTKIPSFLVSIDQKVFLIISFISFSFGYVGKMMIKWDYGERDKSKNKKRFKMDGKTEKAFCIKCRWRKLRRNVSGEANTVWKLEKFSNKIEKTFYAKLLCFILALLNIIKYKKLTYLASIFLNESLQRNYKRNYYSW